VGATERLVLFPIWLLLDLLGVVMLSTIGYEHSAYFEANVNDDSNSLHLLCNCRIAVSIAESVICDLDVGRRSSRGLRKPASSRHVVQKDFLIFFDQLLKCD